MAATVSGFFISDDVYKIARKNSTGELVLSKGENTRTVVDALPNLTAEKRDALGAFGIRWFVGHSMYADKPLFEDGLAVIQKHAPMSRKVNGKNGERIQPGFAPYHDDVYGDAKPWPKYRTAEMKKLDLNYRGYRAWYRCEVRDQVRSTLSLTEFTMIQLSDENCLLKSQVSGYDVRLAQVERLVADLAPTIADLQEATEAEFIQVRAERISPAHTRRLNGAVALVHRADAPHRYAGPQGRVPTSEVHR